MLGNIKEEQDAFKYGLFSNQMAALKLLEIRGNYFVFFYLNWKFWGARSHICWTFIPKLQCSHSLFWFNFYLARIKIYLTEEILLWLILCFICKKWEHVCDFLYVLIQIIYAQFCIWFYADFLKTNESFYSSEIKNYILFLSQEKCGFVCKHIYNVYTYKTFVLYICSIFFF